MTLDSDDIRFMRIFAGVPWKGGDIQQRGNRKRVFWGFGRYVFGTLGNEANVIIIDKNCIHFIKSCISRRSKTAKIIL